MAARLGTARRPHRTRKGGASYMELISAKTLASLMEQKGFGPSRLARYCGHSSHSYISRMSRGVPGARTVTERTATLIAEALGVPVDILFARKEVKSVDPTRAAA